MVKKSFWTKFNVRYRYPQSQICTYHSLKKNVNYDALERVIHSKLTVPLKLDPFPGALICSQRIIKWVLMMMVVVVCAGELCVLLLPAPRPVVHHLPGEEGAHSPDGHSPAVQVPPTPFSSPSAGTLLLRGAIVVISVPDPWHFWYGPGSSEPYLWLTDPDPALYVSDLQDANINHFYAHSFLKVHLHHSLNIL